MRMYIPEEQHLPQHTGLVALSGPRRPYQHRMSEQVLSMCDGLDVAMRHARHVIVAIAGDTRFGL